MDVKKASMTARKGREIVGEVNTNTGELWESKATVGVPQPFQFLDEEGNIATGLKLIKDVPEKPGEYWWKVMLSDIMDILEELSGKQAAALKAILSRFDPNNGIVLTSQREIAEESGISIVTVNKVFRLLMRHDLIRQKNPGVYIINPQFMCQGGGGRYNALMIQYRRTPADAKHFEPTDDVLEVEPVREDE